MDNAALSMLPLNVLAGANSSGKSSLIQSLLLLAQSADEEVILNGPLVRLGEPRDVVRSSGSELTLGYVVDTRANPEAGIEEYSFETTLAPSRNELRVTEFTAALDGRSALQATADRVSASTKKQVDPEGRFGDTLLRVREIEDSPAPPRTYIAFRGFNPEVLLYHRTRKKTLATLRREYRTTTLQADPEKAFILYEELDSWVRSGATRARATEKFGDMIDGWNSRIGPQGLRELGSTELDELFVAFSETLQDDEWVALPVGRLGPSYARSLSARALASGPFDAGEGHLSALRTLSIALEAQRELRDSIRYLGPLREEPQVVSPSGARYRSLPTGPKGEYTADLLARERNSVVRHFDSEGQLKKEPLSAAISRWTNYLGVGENVTVVDQGKLGRGLRIAVNGVDRDLTMIGVGASQLLPVLAVVLSAPPGSLVLLEQPELHLHPAVQSRLADFFLLARPEVRLVVETHSEHLITRIRRRVAEGRVKPDRVGVMFAEQHQGATEFRRLTLNEMGDLSAWPAGFVDTQDHDSRALVRAVHERVAGSRDN